MVELVCLLIGFNLDHGTRKEVGHLSIDKRLNPETMERVQPLGFVYYREILFTRVERHLRVVCELGTLRDAKGDRTAVSLCHRIEIDRPHANIGCVALPVILKPFLWPWSSRANSQLNRPMMGLTLLRAQPACSGTGLMDT